MLEKEIEKKIATYAKLQGWNTYKFSSPSNNGVADRIFIRKGVTLFLEVKRPGNKPTALQKKFLRDMRAQHTLAFWTDKLVAVMDILSSKNPKRARSLTENWGRDDEDLKA